MIGFDYSKISPYCRGTLVNNFRYNDIPGITINIRLPSKIYSKIIHRAGTRYNDIPGVLGISPP